MMMMIVDDDGRNDDDGQGMMMKANPPRSATVSPLVRENNCLDRLVGGGCVGRNGVGMEWEGPRFYTSNLGN
jgi:hypothetical protein